MWLEDEGKCGEVEVDKSIVVGHNGVHSSVDIDIYLSDLRVKWDNSLQEFAEIQCRIDMMLMMYTIAG